MTTHINKRIIGDDVARDETEGVPLDGFQDPTGEYPKSEYFYNSSINKAARGTTVNNLYVGGGDIGVSLNIEPQQPSMFPFNQVKETTSGHVVEYDDTPGGERILIKHRKGAGVEMRADGSLIISAVNNKVEVTGGDQTVIIEGNGNLVYKGNLNLSVTGDYNVDVGGNYNINVAGNKREDVQLNHRTLVSGNSEYTTKGSKSTKTIGPNVDFNFDTNKSINKKTYEMISEQSINMFAEQNIALSGKDQITAASKVISMTGSTISVLGVSGSIGGEMVDFTGKVYQGPAGPTPFTSGAAFYGSFFGQALESQLANQAHKSYFSKYALKEGVPGGGGPVSPLPYKLTAQSPNAPPVLGPIAAAQLTTGSAGIKNISIDTGDILKNTILLQDDYKGLFEKIPTTQEIRSSIRSEVNKALIGGLLVKEKRLNAKYQQTVPPKIGRTSGKAPSSKFGYVPIGNAIANRGKRFTP